ncbi:hypothetical protein BAL199_11416 [alpha proteobacterium BAL199]|nr:hypothetical protein BAL199_11416 [alpha proteobacterium BAL199]
MVGRTGHKVRPVQGDEHQFAIIAAADAAHCWKMEFQPVNDRALMAGRDDRLTEHLYISGAWWPSCQRLGGAVQKRELAAFDIDLPEGRREDRH